MLTSRKWSGKTLADHRADRKAWLTEMLGLPATDPARYAWEPVEPGDQDHMPTGQRLLHVVADRMHWLQALDQARRRARRTPIRRSFGNREGSMSKGIRSATVAEQLLSVEAAAERLDTTPRFIRRLIAERRIEYHKVGRHVRISESALAAFIEAGKVPPLTAADLRPETEGGGLMANKDGHRRFGNVRKLPSGRFQIRYPGPDGRIRTGPETYERKGDADKALVIVEAQMASSSWTDPDRGKMRLGDYASVWIAERPGLRPRTMDLYRWLLRKHIEPYLGEVPVGKMSARLVREWRAVLVGNGVSVSVAAKAYRLLRAIMTTAVDEDNMLARNPCRIKGGGDEDAAERPVLTVRQVFDLAERVGRRPVGNIRKVPDGYRLRFSRNGEMRTSPERYPTRQEAERALWKMVD